MREAPHPRFEAFARAAAAAIGSPTAFVGMCGLTLGWLALGPLVGWSALWQLTFTTALTIATQFTAMLIQATATRHERAMQIKLDHLILTHGPADNRYMHAEIYTEAWLDWLEAENARLREERS